MRKRTRSQRSEERDFNLSRLRIAKQACLKPGVPFGFSNLNSIIYEKLLKPTSVSFFAHRRVVRARKREKKKSRLTILFLPESNPGSINSLKKYQLLDNKSNPFNLTVIQQFSIPLLPEQ